MIPTGLPIKDETIETTVLNLHCLFPYIHDSLELKTCVFIFITIKLANKINGYMQEGRSINLPLKLSYFKIFRLYLQFNPTYQPIQLPT